MIKVLVVHNAYQQFGGEDVVVRAESDLLAKHENLSYVHMVHNKAIHGWHSKVLAATGAVFSLSSYRVIKNLIRKHRPDVVHVHNFYPLISPSVFYACRAAGVPVVLTLHNYRSVCPTAFLMHGGMVTERSLQEGPWWALKHRVYRDSLIGTFFLCVMISVHRRVGTWRKAVTRFIALSEFARAQFVRAGVPPAALAVKPNFVDIPPPSPETVRSGLLFVGRLSPEKGVDTLLDAATRLAADNASTDVAAVSVVGAGPLAAKVASSPLLLQLGALSADEVRQQMCVAAALVIPSHCYEGCPLVLMEAYACGLPVIASRLGGLLERVEEGITGLLFEPGDARDLAAKMAWALEHPGEMRRMGQAARLRYEAEYTSERNFEQLMEVYRDAIASSRKNTHE